MHQVLAAGGGPWVATDGNVLVGASCVKLRVSGGSAEERAGIGDGAATARTGGNGGAAAQAGARQRPGTELALHAKLAIPL